MKEAMIFNRASSRADDRWVGEVAQLISQILNSLEQKVHDMVMHTLIVKEMWECLEELYSGSNNLNKVYDVVHELFWGKKADKPLSQYYTDFKIAFEELRVLFIYRLEKDAT